MNQKGIPVSRWIDGVLENKANIEQPDNLKAMVFWGHAPNSQTRMKEMKVAMEKLDLMVVIDPYQQFQLFYLTKQMVYIYYHRQLSLRLTDQLQHQTDLFSGERKLLSLHLIHYQIIQLCISLLKSLVLQTVCLGKSR